MKSYPSIASSGQAPEGRCHAFVKYDGSNLRFEWDRKRGWHKFGTRNLLFDETSRRFGAAIPYVLDKYAQDLAAVFTTDPAFRGVERFIVFGEWFGARSFAGRHEDGDPKELVLFDVNAHKRGLLGPGQFLDHFGHLQIAESVYEGEMDEGLFAAVREERMDITSKYAIRPAIPEGVICKGGVGHGLWMCKIKTRRYREELQRRHPEDWEELWE
jgi:hypothetical protein